MFTFWPHAKLVFFPNMFFFLVFIRRPLLFLGKKCWCITYKSLSKPTYANFTSPTANKGLKDVGVAAQCKHKPTSQSISPPFLWVFLDDMVGTQPEKFASVDTVEHTWLVILVWTFVFPRLNTLYICSVAARKDKFSNLAEHLESLTSVLILKHTWRNTFSLQIVPRIWDYLPTDS